MHDDQRMEEYLFEAGSKVQNALLAFTSSGVGLIREP